MRQETIEVTYYKFDELSEAAKEHAIEKLSDINVDFEWHDFTIDDIKTIGKIIGIDIDNVYFSGFSSQGDGACFEGHYAYKKGSLKEIKEYAPKDETLHTITESLFKLQAKNFFKLTASVKHSGHYYHENCTIIDVSYYDYNDNDRLTDSIEQDLKELLRDFMRWSYRLLEKDYEYLTSEEAIKETILANEYEFDENGNLQ